MSSDTDARDYLTAVLVMNPHSQAMDIMRSRLEFLGADDAPATPPPARATVRQQLDDLARRLWTMSEAELADEVALADASAHPDLAKWAQRLVLAHASRQRLESLAHESEVLGEVIDVVRRVAVAPNEEVAWLCEDYVRKLETHAVRKVDRATRRIAKRFPEVRELAPELIARLETLRRDRHQPSDLAIAWVVVLVIVLVLRFVLGAGASS